MRTRTIHSVLLTTLLAASATWSFAAEEDSGLRGPVMGYVLDAASHVIRPVNGIPGSSLLGRPVALPFPVRAAAFSPRGDFAVAVSASDDRNAYVLRGFNSGPSINPIESAISDADRVFLNADGSAGALLATAARQLQVLRGLPELVAAGPMFDLSSIPGTITALAINRSGSNILIATSAEHGALYLAEAFDTDSPVVPRLIASFGSPTALALVRDDHDVIVADAAVNQLTLLRNFDGTPEHFCWPASATASPRPRAS